MRLRLGNKHHLRNLQIEKHKSVRWAERTPPWFVLFDLQIFSGGVYSPSATSRTISFSISNSFWYLFFQFFRRERRTVQPKIRSCALLLRSPVNHAIWQCEEYELFRKVQRFWQWKVWTQRISKGEKLRCKIFGKEKRKTLRQYWGAHFWQGQVQNSSPILARQWWRHFRLSLSLYLSLSLSPNVPHTQYKKRFRASYNSALPTHATFGRFFGISWEERCQGGWKSKLT